jgi:hypothetical protein
MVFFSYAYHYFLAASEKMATFVRNKNRATIRTGLFGQAGLPAGEPVEEQVGKQVGEQVKEQTEDRPRTDRGADRKDRKDRKNRKNRKRGRHPYGFRHP